MLSKEEVLDIIAYCKEHRIYRKDRLAQLGIGEWSFYEARRRYLKAESETGTTSGRFIQLRSSGGFVSDSVTEMEKSVNPDRNLTDNSSDELKIECQTPRGGMLRMSGRVTPALLSTLLQNI